MNVLHLKNNSDLQKEFKIITQKGEEPLISFPILNHISVLVGANNSRKSRFLRYLMNETSYLIINYEQYELFDELSKTIETIPNFVNKTFISIENLQAQQGTKPFKKKEEYFQTVINFLAKNNQDVTEVKRTQFQELLDAWSKCLEEKTEESKNQLSELIEKLKATFDFIFEVPQFLDDGMTLNKFIRVRIEDRYLSKTTNFSNLIISLKSILDRLSESRCPYSKRFNST